MNKPTGNFETILYLLIYGCVCICIESTRVTRSKIGGVKPGKVVPAGMVSLYYGDDNGAGPSSS